jgi:pimeloyl-ACP methyl ester carboxylesterase
MNYVEVQGLRIAYEQVGSGPTVILLHGILGDSRMFASQLADMADHFTLVAWDAPGCGQSSDPPSSWRMPDYADCLAEFIAALGLQDSHVLGVSWGGVLALALVDRYPMLSARLVLVGAYAGWAGSLPRDECAQRLSSCFRQSALRPDQFIPDWIPGLLAPAADVELVGEVMNVMSDFHPDGFRIMAQAVADADLRSALSNIDKPTLLIHGEVDARSPVHVGEKLQAAIPGAILTVVPNAGHLCNLENPERFNAEVRSFLGERAHQAAQGRPV